MRARLVVMLVILASLTGCTIGGSSSTGDLRTLEDVGVCTYGQTLDSFPEPALGDAASMRRWADGLLTLTSHLRADWAPDGHPAPKYIGPDVRLLQSYARSFRSAVYAAGHDRQRLQAAFGQLAAPEFARANSEIEVWDRLNCSGS